MCEESDVIGRPSRAIEDACSEASDGTRELHGVLGRSAGREYEFMVDSYDEKWNFIKM